MSAPSPGWCDTSPKPAFLLHVGVPHPVDQLIRDVHGVAQVLNHLQVLRGQKPDFEVGEYLLPFLCPTGESLRRGVDLKSTAKNKVENRQQK